MNLAKTLSGHGCPCWRRHLPATCRAPAWFHRVRLMPHPAVSAVAAREHRIAIRTVNGTAEFYDRETGARFVPRGAALWRWRWLRLTNKA